MVYPPFANLIERLVLFGLFFTPLENPGIYAWDVINRKHQLLAKAGSNPTFLTGFTDFPTPFSSNYLSHLGQNLKPTLSDRNY
jgi:hypothetical protein